MRYYSPYSSRTRPPIWPKFLIVFLVLAILGSGGWLAWSLNNRHSTDSVAGINATLTSASAVASNSTVTKRRDTDWRRPGRSDTWRNCAKLLGSGCEWHSCCRPERAGRSAISG